MIHCGYNEKQENIFAGFHPEKYIDYFKKQSPDILCLAECLFDDKEGNSAFVEALCRECDLPYYRSLATEKAFLGESQFYGLAICTKFPFVSYQIEKLANPHLETIRPSGDHWILHDKYIQKAVLDVENVNLNLVNTHMFPFQHFGKHFWDDEFVSYRQQWANVLKPNHKEKTIITGDFNTVGIGIKEAFPELEIGHKMFSLVNYDGKKYQPLYPYETQIEYLLASRDIQLVWAKEEMIYSDHPFLIADVVV